MRRGARGVPLSLRRGTVLWLCARAASRGAEPPVPPSTQPLSGATPPPSEAETTKGRSASVTGKDGEAVHQAGLNRHLNADYHRFRARQRGEEQQRLRQARRSRDPREATPQTQQSTRQAAPQRRPTQFADDEAYWGEEPTDRTGAAPVPMVHPGATDLPPLRQPANKPRFSFVAHSSEKAEKDFYSHSGVPNNTPKPLLPMWASSLTSPSLGKQRLEQENWISSDSLGYVAASRAHRFLKWLTSTASTAAEQTEGSHASPQAQWTTELEQNVELLLRKHQCRGVYARRAFAKNDVIFRVPLFRTDQITAADGQARPDTHAQAWVRTLNAEVLAQCSDAAHDRSVPSYEAIKTVLSVQRSSFDPTPHPLFIDQMHLAMLLACERAAGPESPLAPYLSLFNDCDKADDMLSGRQPLLDDDHIQDLYRGVLEPSTHLEYKDHINRFQHFARELHKLWWETYSAAQRKDGDGAKLSVTQSRAAAVERTRLSVLRAPPLPITEDTSANGGLTTSDVAVPGGTREEPAVVDAVPAAAAVQTASPDALASSSTRPAPPPLEDLEWAMRFVLSRQRVLPGVRVNADAVMAAEAEQDGWEKRELDWFARAVVKAKVAFYDHVFRAVDRDRVNVNAFDVHAAPTVVPLLDLLQHPPGGVANTAYAVEQDVPDSSASSSSSPSQPWVVVRATEDIEPSDELTLQFQRGYSLSYSLYRYGFLPLRQREDDMRDFMDQHGLGGDMKPLATSSNTRQHEAKTV